MFCDILNPDGAPYEGDPRWALKRNLKKAADRGYTMQVGPELEFFYFKDAKGTEILDRGGYFDLTPLDVASDLRRDTINALESMGIQVEYSHHEVAPSQHEIDLRYTDALAMADAAMTYRLTVKEMAMQHGVYATFMPKPIFGENGSGMHVHQSLFGEGGTPSSTGVTNTTCRRRVKATSRGCSGTRKNCRPSWPSGSTPTSDWYRDMKPPFTSHGPGETDLP